MNILYFILYYGWKVLSLLPLKVLYVFSDILFFFIFHIFHYRRRIVWYNIVSSFPEKTEEEWDDIERRFYHWFCDYIVETIKLLTISKKEIKRRVIFNGCKEVNKCIDEDQSCAVYLGHYCNWEWITSLPLWVTQNAQCGQIYHPLENKTFNKLFLQLRQRWGAKCIAMDEILRKTIDDKRNKQKTVIGYISDQTPHWNNIHHWCNFLHHDTPVFTGTERIAKKFDQAVFYMDVKRVKRGYYEAEFKLITNEPKKMSDYELTDIYFRELEKTIQSGPEFWLWSHKRWKRTREKFKSQFNIVNGKVVHKK